MAVNYTDLEKFYIEIFGTPHPDNMVVALWRQTWAKSQNRVKVTSYTIGMRLCRNLGISELFYQLRTIDDIKYVILYRDEDYVLAKLSA